MRPEVASLYDLWSATYDTDPSRTRDLAGEVLRKAGLGYVGRSVVEIGCGTGRNTLWLSERADRVIAMDFSEGMLHRAKASVKSPRVHFVRHDIRSGWPLADGSADAVLASLVLEHVERLDVIFAETARVLKPGGNVLICELHPMRQMLGRQAEFVDPATAQRVLVPAFLHDVSDYVNGGLACGLKLLRLEEFRLQEDDRTELPRLLSINFERS